MSSKEENQKQLKTEIETETENESNFLLGSDLVKCPNPKCKCLFFTQHDLQRHLGYDEEGLPICGHNMWKRSSYGTNEFYTEASNFPNITTVCLSKKKMVNGMYTYTLSENRKWLRRKHN